MSSSRTQPDRDADVAASTEDALRLAFSWIAPLPEGPDSEATCAYVPREVYDRLKEAVDAAK